MKKITTSRSFYKELVNKFPKVKPTVMPRLLLEIAEGMDKQGLIAFKEVSKPNLMDLGHLDEVEYKMQAYALSPTEIENARNLIAAVKTLLPENHRVLAEKLESILLINQ
tara:strand:+ start:808 stop:1137 length:330 start_codon:yes stop_codon:yes gene_type:complete